MFDAIKTTVESVLDCRIYRHSIPQGTDIYYDLKRSFGLEAFQVVFDIGANVGQSAVEYCKGFPHANIYSFEPVSSTFQTLLTNIQGQPRIQAYQCGMGAQQQKVTIGVNDISTISSISNQTIDESAPAALRKEEINMETVDAFCAAKGLRTIDFLKTDTEGYELQVLKGCQKMLENQQIKVLMAECSPRDNDDYFVSFSALNRFLEEVGYELYGIYGQQLEWNGRKRVLFFNPVFVCPDYVNRK